jgi:hypothetical protein
VKPRLSTILSALSLLLCVLVVALWVRNLWVSDLFEVRLKRQEWQLLSERNILHLNRSSVLQDKDPCVLWSSERDGYHGPPLPGRWGHGSFRYAEYRGDVIVREWWMPHWMAAMATGVWPGLLALQRCRKRYSARGRPGLCPACGYDLRATPGRCPECGAVPDSAGVGKVSE